MDPATDAPDRRSERLSAALARVGLVGTAVLCWRAASQLWEGGTTPTDPLATVSMLVATAVGFVLLGFAVTEHRRLDLAPWLVPPALAVVSWCYLHDHAAAQLQNGPVTTDVQIYMDYAARLLRDGINPYTADLLDAYRVQRMPLTFSTPLADGDLTGRVAYPALHVLLFVPFQWLGIPTTWVYPLSLLAALAAIYAASPRAWRPVVLLPFFVDSRILLFTLGGVSDGVWAMLLCFMVLQWRRPVARAVWFGLALSFKHQPWALGPFLLVRIWRETAGDHAARRQALYRFAGIAAATFGVINLPFIFWSPEAWLSGMLEPLVAPMITFGQGLSALSMSAIAPLPKWIFSLLTAVTLLAGLALYDALYPRAKLALWLVPAVALWLSHRSLSSYWYFFLLPLIADALTAAREPAPATPLPRPQRRRALAAVGALVAVALLAVVVGLRRSPPFAVTVQPPLYTSGARVTKLEVAVENRTDQPIQPRIAVQSVGLQPYFWIVDRGAPTLEPGGRDVYRVRAGAPHEEFSVRRGAKVIVTAAGDLSLRAAALVPGDVTDAYRDAIPNGRFRYFVASGDRPTFWGLVAEPAGAGRATPGKPTGEGAPASSVVLELAELVADVDPAEAERRVLLDTFVVLPHEPVEITVRVPPEANRLPDLDVLYGLRLMVRDHEVWVLFGDEPSRGDLPGGARYVMVEAPREAWSRHSLDLRALLAELYDRPLRPRYERHSGVVALGYPVVPANLQLALAARAPVGKLAAEFGPVVATVLRPEVERLFAETRAMPELMALWRGDLAFTYGNYDKARQHYLAAAELVPAEPLPLLRLAETEFWIGHWEAALGAYQAALNRDAKEPLAYKGAGWCHYNLGRYDEASAAWRSALRLFELEGEVADPSHAADARRGLAMAAWRTGRCDVARRQIAAARELLATVEIPPELERDCAR